MATVWILFSFSLFIKWLVFLIMTFLLLREKRREVKDFSGRRRLLSAAAR